MKSWLQRSGNPICTKMPYMLICFFLIAVLSSYSIVPERPVSRHDSNNSIVIKISQHSKIHRIKLYPNATNEVLFFMAEGEEGKLYQLFIFDVEGKLIRQTQVRNRETTLLCAFGKGNYLIEILSNDERIENGSIVVK